MGQYHGVEESAHCLGQDGELHEAAFTATLSYCSILESTNIQVKQTAEAYIVHWQVTQKRQLITFGDDLEVHLLWRNEAFDHWVIELPAPDPIGNFTSPSKSNVIVKAGYLIRSASISGQELSLIGDLNRTTPTEVISTPVKVTSLSFNGKKLNSNISDAGRMTATVPFTPPTLNVPTFADQVWKYIDSLSEINATYDDSLWTNCSHISTTNPRNLTTPTSLRERLRLPCGIAHLQRSFSW